MLAEPFRYEYSIPATNAFELMKQAYEKRNVVLGALFPDLGLKTMDVEKQVKKTWNPMDRQTPPNCPFTTEDFYLVDYSIASIEIRVTANWWKEQDLSNLTFTLSVRDAGNLKMLMIRNVRDTQNIDSIDVSFFDETDEAMARVICTELINAVFLS